MSSILGVDDTLFPTGPVRRIQDPFISSGERRDDPFLTSAAQDELEKELFQDLVGTNSPMTEEEEDNEVTYYSDSPDENPEAEVKKAKRSRRGKKKPKANAWSRGTKVEAVKAIQAAKEVEERPKLYEQKPFVDPELERCRKNALSAKLNRERKKQEQEKIRSELETLRRENERLRKREEEMALRARQAEERLARVAKMIKNRGILEMVSCGEEHVRKDNCSTCWLDTEE